jgi:hypothetical protein
MHERAANIFHESVDCMFFANFQIHFRKKQGAQKSRAIGEGTRRMYTEERPAFRAKRRYNLPFEMDLDWNAFIAAVGNQHPQAPLDKVLEIFSGIEDAALSYLLEIKWLQPGQALTDLMEVRRKAILDRAPEFIAAVNKHAAPEPITNENENE